MRYLHLKTTLIFLILTTNGFSTFSQSYNDDKTTFGNFLKRMYTATPFEGIKIVDDYNQSYLVSVITLDKSKYTSMSVMNRVAQVKAQSQANTFINGSSISSDMIIKTSEKKSNNSVESITETFELIKENSYGFTKGLELITNFDNQDGTRTIFIYFRALNIVK